MARDDFRIRIELPEERGAAALLERLGLDLGSEARELARGLQGRRLVVSRDGNELFVYASSAEAAARAREIVASEVRDEGAAAIIGRVERWLPDEDRWSDEPTEEAWEEELLAEGYSPWEVRVECASVDEARELAAALERDGYGVARRFRYVLVGTATHAEAEELARRLHGDVEPSARLVWETLPWNPFAVLGGLGSAGTPLG